MADPGNPKFAVAACTTFHASYADDLRIYSSSGIDGIGIWEYKLLPGRDKENAASLRERGLRATFCFPNVKSVLHGDAFDYLLSQPRDHAGRVEMLCAGIRCLAQFDPVAVCLLSGPAGDIPRAIARSRVIDGLQQAAQVAADLEVPLAIEVMRPPSGDGFARDIPEALELLADAGTDQVDILVDSWHTQDEAGLADVRRHISRIVGVHVCGKRPGAVRAEGMDRRLPGEDADLPMFLRAVREAGYAGWYELEIFSDDGTFGTSYPDSLWAMEPAVLIEEGRKRFLDVWRQS